MYSISEVAQRVNLSVSTLRYYDYQGILFFINKDENGYRMFTEQDIEDIIFIKELKNYGISLKQIKDIVGVYRESGHSASVKRKLLYAYEQSLIQKLRQDVDRLLRLQTQIRELDELLSDESCEQYAELLSSLTEGKEIGHIL